MKSPDWLRIEDSVVFWVASQIMNFSFGASEFNNCGAIKSSVFVREKDSYAYRNMALGGQSHLLQSYLTRKDSMEKHITNSGCFGFCWRQVKKRSPDFYFHPCDWIWLCTDSNFLLVTLAKVWENTIVHERWRSGRRSEGHAGGERFEPL